MTLTWRELGTADFAQHLPFGAIIRVKVIMRSTTAGTDRIFRNAAGRAPAYRFDFLTISFFEVRNQVFVSPILLEVSNQRKFINLEFLIFRGMGIIKSPLL